MKAVLVKSTKKFNFKKQFLIENNDTNYLVPYMIHCTWSKKSPQKLHQPTRLWRALWTHKTMTSLILLC